MVKRAAHNGYNKGSTPFKRKFLLLYTIILLGRSQEVRQWSLTP